MLAVRTALAYEIARHPIIWKIFSANEDYLLHWTLFQQSIKSPEIFEIAFGMFVSIFHIAQI